MNTKWDIFRKIEQTKLKDHDSIATYGQQIVKHVEEIELMKISWDGYCWTKRTAANIWPLATISRLTDTHRSTFFNGLGDRCDEFLTVLRLSADMTEKIPASEGLIH